MMDYKKGQILNIVHFSIFHKILIQTLNRQQYVILPLNLKMFGNALKPRKQPFENEQNEQ